MADNRVHPTASDSYPTYSPTSSSPPSSGEHQKPAIPPPPASYVVQLPREHILRYPPPGNARRFRTLSLHRNRRSCRGRCCCFILCFLLIMIIASAVSAGVLHLVFLFESPRYAITRLEIRGMNLTAESPISPRFDVDLRAENPNKKIGIYYLEGNDIGIFYSDVELSRDAFPAFYQPAKNFTVVSSTMTGSDIVLGGDVKAALKKGQNQKRVPFVVRLKAPVKFKVGSARSWELSVKVKCDVVLDALNDKANIVKKKCNDKLSLW